jgi:hypothetical protein
MRFLQNNIGSIDCVVSRYNEYINWIVSLPSYINKIYIYNKGENDLYFKNFTPPEELLAKLIFIKLPNIGRIDHTIAYHIINNWDCLPDNLIFLPGTSVMCIRKGEYLFSIKKNIQKLKLKHRGFFAPRFHKVSENFNFSRETYMASGICNRNNNPFIKSEYKTLKDWKSALIDDIPLKYIQYRGMFAVSKENILYINKTIYENILNSLSIGDNIENGHYAERIWAHLFKQYSDLQLTL